MKPNPINFICVLRSGGDFDKRYVLNLKRNVDLHTTEKHWFICLNDIYEVPAYEDGINWLPLKTDFPGRWSKIELFHPGMKMYRPWLFLDLDTFIVGNLSSMLRVLSDLGRFAMLHDFYKPDRPASGVIYTPEHVPTDHIWERFNENPQSVMAPSGKWQDDGRFIYECVYPELILQREFPGKILTYKPLLGPGRPGRLEVVPPDCSIVCFHGNPRPHQAIHEMQWVKDYWQERPIVNPIIKLSTYDKQHSGTLVIIGSGPTWKDDLRRVKGIRKKFKTMVIGHAAGFVKADFVVSDHYEIHEELVRLQTRFHEKFTNHCTFCYSSKAPPWIDYTWEWPRSKATSLETAVRIGLAVGFEEIIVCGCPMESAKIQHPDQVKKDGEQWPPPNGNKGRGSEEELKLFRKEFCRLVPSWSGRVFSMSGFTGRMLGEPE